MRRNSRTELISSRYDLTITLVYTELHWGQKAIMAAVANASMRIKKKGSFKEEYDVRRAGVHILLVM